MTIQTVQSSFGPLHLQPTADAQVMATFKPSIWPKVDLFFTLEEALDLHTKLGAVIVEAAAGQPKS